MNRIILSGVTLGLIAAVVTIFIIPKKYTATSRIFAVPNVTSTTTDYTSINANDKMVNNYMEMLKGTSICDSVDASLGLTEGTTIAAIKVSNQADTQPKEAKSTTAINIGYLFATKYEKVFIVECELYEFIESKVGDISSYQMIRHVDGLYILFSSNKTFCHLITVYNTVKNAYSYILKVHGLDFNAEKCDLREIEDINEEPKRSFYDEYVNDVGSDLGKFFYMKL